MALPNYPYYPEDIAQRGRTGSIIKEWFPEFILASMAIATFFFMKILVAYALLRSDMDALYYFQAHGIVHSIDVTGDSIHLVVWGEDPVLGIPATWGIKSRALLRSPTELKPEARFEKGYATRKCLINGQEYDFY